jgi:putative transcriptional regulator
MRRASAENELSEVLAAAEEGLAALRAGKKLVRRTANLAEPSKFTSARVARLRKRLGVSQAVFAQIIGASLGTVRAWEQGIKTPSGIACRILEVAEREPRALTRSLKPAI